MYLEDLPAAARAIRQRLTTSRALVEAALRRYDEREPVLRAFAWLDRDRALRLADEADRTPASPDRPLHGVPVGVKDIFDTAGIPTESGSAVFRGRVPDRTATSVERLERAGAIVIGKTVTAELAFYSPGPTTNPHDPARTPGGSSSGSAAAVAAGIVPGAIGSQTNGSVIRPAAFCGVVGVKPTRGRLPTDGVMPFAPTLDHVGAFARTVEGAAWLCAVMAGEPIEDWWSGPAEAPRLAAVRTKDWEKASEPMRALFQRVADALASAGRPIEWPALPAGLDDAIPTLGTIMRYEGARHVGRRVKGRERLVSEVALGLFAQGELVPDEEYERALRDRERVVASFSEWARPYDGIVTLSAKGEPPTIENTGDPVFCSRWTLVGAPAVSVPIGVGPSGLPLGLQVVGAPGDDRRVLASAAFVEGVVGRA